MSTSLAAFESSVTGDMPPSGVSPALTALWWSNKGEWTKAHAVVMDDEGADCAWVHAYLHRTEPDLANARYWYARAGRPVATGPLDAEWRVIAATLLGDDIAAADIASRR